MDIKDLEGSSRATLKGPGDWKHWISVIQKFATAQSVWDYIDPSNTQKPALVKPTEPTTQQIRADAQDLADLNAEEFRRLEFLHTRYRSQLQSYRDQQKALNSIQQHIVKTIGNYYSVISDEHDVASELALLQARVQPTDWAHEQEVLERYYDVLKALNRSTIEAWITSWQKVLSEAKKLDLPDTKGLRPTRQFLQAVSSVNQAFTDYWINKMEDEARTGSHNWQATFPDGIKISEIFERAHKSKKAAHSKGSFASFQGEDDNTQASTGTASHTTRKPHCLCGKYHFYGECYYLNESIRPQGWRLNKHIEQTVKQQLEDPKIKSKVDRAIGQRQEKDHQRVQDTPEDKEADIKGSAFARKPPQDQTAQGAQHPIQQHQDQSAFSTTKIYPLRDSFILDSGSDTHICNDLSRFSSYQPCRQSEIIYAGDGQLEILGYGRVLLRIGENSLFQLNNVAYIPAFHTNVASLDLFLDKGYNWNPATGAITKDSSTICYTKRIYRQPVIEYNEVDQSKPTAVFLSSSEPRPEQSGEATLWHQRLGHLNAAALEHLVEHTTGARIKGPIQIDCKACSQAKATRIVSRRSPQTRAPRPFWRIYIDIFSMNTSYNGKEAALIIRDEFTGMIFIYLLKDQTQETILNALQNFEAMIQRQYQLGICRIHRDNDQARQLAYIH